jgi:hypothetical protein
VPVHAPFTHAWFVQSAAVPHVPEAPHVSTPLFEHCLAPGEQVPAHAPLTHAWFVQATGVPHVPEAPHV